MTSYFGRKMFFVVVMETDCLFYVYLLRLKRHDFEEQSVEFLARVRTLLEMIVV
jgi:hypothetical protein